MSDETIANSALDITPEKAAEIEASLAVVFSGTTEVEDEKTSTEESVETLDAESKPVEGEAADANPDASGAEPDAADKSPTLPDNIQRALIATGWTEEEITEQHAALGDEFEKIADKVYQKRMSDSREWAAHGRMVRDTEESNQPKKDDSPPKDQLSRIDVEALKEKYGHDESISSVIEEMAGPMNLSIEALKQVLPTIAESQARQDKAEDAILRQEINGFFASKGLADYSKHYGEGSTESLVGTDAHKNRMKVLQHTDQLRVGATYQGSTLELADALSLAHDAVSGDWKMDALREEMKSKMQQRAKSVTLKPADSATSATTSSEGRSPVTRKDMESKAAIALRRVFG